MKFAVAALLAFVVACGGDSTGPSALMWQVQNLAATPFCAYDPFGNPLQCGYRVSFQTYSPRSQQYMSTQVHVTFSSTVTPIPPDYQQLTGFSDATGHGEFLFYSPVGYNVRQVTITACPENDDPKKGCQTITAP